MRELLPWKSWRKVKLPVWLIPKNNDGSFKFLLITGRGKLNKLWEGTEAVEDAREEAACPNEPNFKAPEESTAGNRKKQISVF